MVKNTKIRISGTFSILFGFCICIMAVFFVVGSFDPAAISLNSEVNTIHVEDHDDHEQVNKGFDLPGLSCLQQSITIIRIISFTTVDTPGFITTPILPPPENLIF